MPETPQQPLIDRASLEDRFGEYKPIQSSEPLPNIPFTGLSMQTPSFGGGGDREPISAVQALDNAIKPRGDGALRGGSIARSIGELTNPRYNAFVPGDYNNEDAYAQGQSWTEKMANGVGKGLVLTGTTFLQSTVGLANGLVNWMADGKFSSFYNNDFNKSLDNINVELDNNLLPNYYTDVEKNAAWYSPDNLFTANFLWNGVVKNLGFAAGAALSGGVYSAGIKALSSLPGISRLVSIGKQAEVVAATEAGLLGANKAADTYGKIKSLSDRFLSSYNVLNPGGRAVVAGLATTGEAGFEAYQSLNEKRNELIEEFTNSNNGVLPTGSDLEEINRKAEEVGNSTFLANVALLTATNYIQFPKILGSSYTSEKGMINSLIRETKDIVEKQGVYIAKPAVGGKFISTLNKIRPYTFSVSEAFEEGAQFAIGKGVNDYYNKKENNEPTNFIKSLAQGFVQTFTTDEGMENVLIGGLSGAIMQGKGRYAEEKEKSKNTALAIEAFNKFKLSDFTKDTIDSVNRGTVLQQEREELLKSGDILNSKDKEADYIINYLAPRIKYGRYDLVAADIEDYKILASIDFAQLQAEGKALPTDTKEAYLQRLNNLQATANNVKSLYQSLNLRYGGRVDENGSPIYSSEVMDKMVYAASKIADYDTRIPAVNSKLVAAGINIDPIIKDIIEGKVESFNATIDNIKSITNLTEDDKITLGEAFEDVVDMNVRRNYFLKSYDDIKNNPKNYKSAPVEVSKEMTPEEISKAEAKEEILIKTKKGEKAYEVGKEYFVGKSYNYDKEGLETPVQISQFFILGENSDGTIKIKDNKGQIRDIDKSLLEEYHLKLVSEVVNDKMANYFFNHRNEMFEFNFGEKVGKIYSDGSGKRKGRLEYKGGELFFVYKNYKGKLLKKKLERKHFYAQPGFKEARIKQVGSIKTKEQSDAENEMLTPEEIKKEKSTLSYNREGRLEIIMEIESDARARLEEVNKKLETKKKEIESIQKGLIEIGADVKVSEPRTKREKALEEKYPELSRQKQRFKNIFSTTSKSLLKLSRMKESVGNEIAELEKEREELELNLAYFEDFSQNLDELPENTGEFLKELKDQVNWLEMLISQTGKDINVFASMAKDIEKTIKDFTTLLQSSLQKFDKDYPSYIKDSFERIKDNPVFELVEGLKKYIEDYALLKDTEKEISVSEEQLSKINEEVNLIYKQLNELGSEYAAKKKILDVYQEVYDAYEARKLEEELITSNEKLKQELLGTADATTQTSEFDESDSKKDYELNAKKSNEIIPRATIGVMRGKPHQIRANAFGFNLERFENRNNIRGVYITSKNEDKLIPGLTDHLRIDESGQINEDIDKDNIIAMVMVEEIDGEIRLIGEDGKPLPEGADLLNSAIYQVYPDKGLKWGNQYGNSSMFREDTADEVIETVTEQYTEWRKSVLENENIDEVHTVGASFGTLELEKDEQGDVIYETRTSVKAANLITKDELETSKLILIPTTSETVDKGTTNIKVKSGSPILETANGLVRLQNRKHTEEESEVIYQAIVQLAKYMINPEVGINHPKSERILNWLRSVVYWGIPETQEGERKPAGYNSIFFEKDEVTGKLMLSLSGKGKDFRYTPSSLEMNKSTIMFMLNNMYNNINSSMTKNINESYEEILSISKDGEIESRMWKNYQSYLLEDVTPDGQKRKGEELPLSTFAKPVSENEINRTNIYFYTTDTADNFVIPVVEKKKSKIVTVGKGVGKKDTSPSATKAPVSDKKADIESKKQILLNKIYDATINELEDGTFELTDNQGGLIAEAKTREELEEKFTEYKKRDDEIRKELAALEAPVSDNTKTPIEGLNKRLEGYGNAKIVLPANFYEGEKPKGRLNAFKDSVNKVADNLIILADLNLSEFDFLSAEDKTRLDALRPLAEELRKINTNDISSEERRTISVEKRYAQLTNQLSNEFVDVVGKHVKQQLDKTITSSNPKLAALKSTPSSTPSVKPNPPGEYEFDGTTVNTYVTPQGKTLYFRASSKVNEKNYKTEILIVQGGDVKEIIDIIKKANKDPQEQLTKTILQEILPFLQKIRSSEDEESFTIGSEEETVVISEEEEDSVSIEESPLDETTASAVEDAESKLGRPISKSVADALKKKIKDKNKKALRVILEKELKRFTPENWSDVEKWLNSKFPNVPVYRVKNVIQATNGRQAWGMFKDGAIYLYENAEVGTVYHEVFHAVWRMMSDPTEQAAIISEMKNREGKFFDRSSLKDVNYKDATDDQLEEKLAEEFRDYVQSKKIPQKPLKGRPYILKLFADMVTMIKTFFIKSDSASKVNEMFSKIEKGYYKTYIPYETSLSYAKKGIIDIEDVVVDSDSVFSLAGITDVERNEIIQHMTYLTLLDILKTDKSLFELSKINKKELYDKIKEQLLETIAVKKESANDLIKEAKTETEKKEFRQSLQPVISNIILLMENIDNQWDEIVELHQQYLRGYAIEFDENDILTLNDENNSGRETYQDATKIDNFKKAGAAIKLLLSTIPKVDDDLNIEPSSINGAILVPVGKIYISLMNTLHSSQSIEEMMERFRKMAETDPTYRTLYARVTKRDWKEKGVDFSKIENEHSLRLINSFWATFKKQGPGVKNVFFLENGDIVVGDANLSSAAQQLKNEFINGIVIKARGGKGYYKYVDKIYVGNPDKVKGVVIDKYPQMIEFLNNLGINMSISDVNKMSDSQKAQFRDVVSGIKESISKSEKIVTFSGKSLNIDKRLLTLGLIKSSIDNPEFSSTFFNVSGERTQTFIGTNAVSDLSDFLSSLTRFNKDTVGNSKYSYLLTDSFAQGSNIISRMFSESKGIRKEGTDDLFKVEYVSGIVDEEKGTRKESSKLNYVQRLIQEINLNLSGYYLNLVPGDASIEWMIKMGNPVSIDSINKGMYDVNQIFSKYFISELNLSRETNRKVVEGRVATDMRFFKGILGDTLHDEIIKYKDRKGNIPSAEQVYKDFENKINSKVKEYIQNQSNSLLETLKSYGVISPTDKGYESSKLDLPSVISKEQLDNQMKMLTVNYMIANIEMHKILYSDPYQYSDELKRIKSFNSPRQAIINNSPKMNTALNKVWNKIYGKNDIGRTNFIRDYFRSATHKDIIGVIDLPNYEDFKETDGSGIITLKGVRNFRIRASNWNSDEERQYIYDIAYEKIDKGRTLTDEQKENKGLVLTKEELAIYNAGNPGIKSTYTPIKPIVAGAKYDKNGNPSKINEVVLDKFALYPISYRIFNEMDSKSNALNLYEKMQKEDIDYIVFESARKVGAEELHDTYNEEDGSFNTTPYKGVINIPFSIMSVQAEVPSKDVSLVTRGSQVTKLITLDFMEAGVPIDFMPTDTFEKRYEAWYNLDEKQKLTYEKNSIYSQIIKNRELLNEMIEVGYESTLFRLGIKETVTKDKQGNIKSRKFEIVDNSKIVKTLREEVLKREVNDNISSALTGFLEGKVVLEATPAYQQIRNIIYSIADKEFISPKINGGMKVQIPSTLFESSRVAKTTINGKEGYTSDILKFYEKDGKRVAEVMIGRWFDSNLSDEELLNYLNTTDEGQRILSGIGYRIPTQKQNSIDAIVVKKFLPKEFGDSVVIPAALVQKVGSDFDIDKLSMYFKNIYKDVSGKIRIVELKKSRKETEEFYANEFDEILQKKQITKSELLDAIDILVNNRPDTEGLIDKYEFVINNVLDKSDPEQVMLDIENKLKKLTDMELQKTMKEEYVKRMYKEALENAYIESMEYFVKHPLNYNSLIKPNSAESLKSLSKKIATKTVGGTFDYKNVNNMLDRNFMSRLRHAFVTGKYAIGIAAVNQTNHALNQLGNIYIDKTKMELVSDDDKLWLGDLNIKFKDYNKIALKDGRVVPTLSMIKNKAEEYISDIIGMFIDGYVDISKGPWIMELGATPNVASTWLFLVKLGVPINQLAYFMNQPIIRDYLRQLELSGYSWLFIDNYVKGIGDAYDVDMGIEELGKKRSTFTIPSEVELEKLIGKKKSELSKEQKNQQYLMLLEFLKYAKMAEHMFHVTQGSNFDTATFNDPYLVFKKQLQRIKANNTIISSVETILSNSFVGPLSNRIRHTRDAFSEILMSDRKNIRKVVEKVLLPYVNMNDRDFVKISQKVVNDLFDWAVQVDQKLNITIQEILIGDGVAKDVFTFVNSVKNDPEHPLHFNQVVTSLEPLPSKKSGDNNVNNIKLKMGDNKVYDQNNMIYAFRELREYLKGEENPLYNRIVTLSILQSGLSSSPISFTSLLPYEDFEEVYNKTLSKIEGLSELDNFYTLGVFQRNNWNNDDIAPHMSAKYNEKLDVYNIAMEYLPKEVKSAVKSKDIPPVMTLSKYQRESNSEYIVYTWKKSDSELLTKEDIQNGISAAKKVYQMKKVGDMSYLNKTLMKKVRHPSTGEPFEHVTPKGAKYFVYKAINAWGDSFRANEFWLTEHSSVIENGFIKVEGVEDDSIINKFVGKVSKKVTVTAPTATTTVSGVEITKTNYTRENVRKNPNTAYVFTENTHSITAFPNTQGGGSAIIRPEPNAFAIVTKKKYDYNTRENVDYSDTPKDFAEFTEVNTRLINELKNSGKSKIVFPQGFATDKAKMPTRFAEWLQKALLDNFGLVTELNSTKTGLISKSVSPSPTALTTPLTGEYTPQEKKIMETKEFKEFFEQQVPWLSLRQVFDYYKKCKNI